MSEHAYYEISRWNAAKLSLNVTAMPGNMIFNRRHWQNGIEVLTVIKGNLHVKIEDKEYDLSEGDLITIDTGLLHEVSSGAPDNLHLIFNVDDKLMRRVKNEQIWMSTVGTDSLPRTDPDVVCVRRAVAKLSKFCEQSWLYDADQTTSELIPNDDWYDARIELNRVLRYLSKHTLPQASTSKTIDPGFIRFIDTIHRNYAKDISAETVAKELGYGVSTIYRMSREYTAMSFNEYLNSVRVSMACGMLAQSQISAIEVAFSCGFTTSSNFYRVFKLLTGLTPLEYREHAGNNRSNNTNQRERDELLRYNQYQSFHELPYSWSDIFDSVGAQ